MWGFISRLVAMFHLRRADAEFDDEVAAHLDMLEAMFMRKGMSRKDAAYQARRQFGNAALLKQRQREARTVMFFASLWRDLKFGARQLRKSPTFTTACALTLALGLGAVTITLALVDSVIWRPVALPHPEQLVMMSIRMHHDGLGHTLTYRQINTLRRDAHSFAAIGEYNTLPRPVGTADGTRVAVSTMVSTNLFQLLGVHAKYGRLLGDTDENAPVAVVSYAFWQERLHSDPKAVGSTIKLLGQLQTVVGVLPDGVHFPQGTEAPVVYTPIFVNGKGEDQLSNDSPMLIARLKSGVSMQQAGAEARSIYAHMNTGSAADRRTLEIHSYQKYLTGDVQPALLALLGGSAVLLLIACANSANLQIARVTGRITEMNVRSALGASFGRILQQVATESVMVSLLGAGIGAMLAYELVAIIRSMYGREYPRFDELAVHPAVFGTCALLAVLTGILASLAPVFSIRRQSSAITTTTRVTRRSHLPGLLVALQIALTCTLLTASGLFVRTLHALEDVNLGFDPRGVTTLVLMPENQNKNPEASRQTETRLLERLSGLPGVESAMMQTSLPFSSYDVTLHGTTEVIGRAFHAGDAAFYSLVSTNFVKASRIPLKAGRGFLPQDDGSRRLVALVNEAFVKKYLTGRNPIGAGLEFHREPNEGDADVPFTQPMTVVGVVANELQGGDLGAPYEPMVYLNYRQLPTGSMLSRVFSMWSEFAIRSTLPQEVLSKEVRTAVRQIAPDMAEMNLAPMEEAIAYSLNQRRLAFRLVVSFGGVALLLAAIGIYGVLAYSVERRRKEIGIRMALGSSRRRAIWLVMEQAGGMVMLGSLAGLAATWPVGRAIKSFLFGVQPLDPWAMIGAAMMLLAVCAVATIAPAWRAAHIDPMEALRAE